MYVKKRDGRSESVHFDKITKRIISLSKDLPNIDPALITQKTGKSLHDGVETSEIDEHSASIAASLLTKHYEYGILAAKISISNLQKNAPKKFSDAIEILHKYYCKNSNKTQQLISTELYELVTSSPERKELIDSQIKHERDFKLNYFGFHTLKKNYLLKKDGKIIETYQYLLMRVSLGIHGNDLKSAFETYELLSSQHYTHATPTLFNSGTIKPQLASCFLAVIPEDSMEGVFQTLHKAAEISKHAGGIGLAISNMRATNSSIGSLNGKSKGLVPYLSVLNATMRYVDQGGCKRPGACCVYLEPWHADVFDFIELRKNTGNDERRCRDLFLALWVPNLFMEKVKQNEDWHLFCPLKAPNLQEVYGKEFEKLYEKYVKEKRFNKVIKARKLMKEIARAQIETGNPFMLYKDTANLFSNQRNLGIIKLSNLCTEIIEFSNKDEISVCNLLSINLKSFVEMKVSEKERLKQVLNSNVYSSPSKQPLKEVSATSLIKHKSSSMKTKNHLNNENKENEEEENLTKRLKRQKSKDFYKFDVLENYNFKKLYKTVYTITHSLNKTIDRTFYPLEETKRSNKKNRPIGIGVQGLADTFYELRIAFDSDEAKILNVRIFETIYHAALSASIDLAKEDGAYESFKGSPYSKGILHFDWFFEDLLRENFKNSEKGEKNDFEFLASLEAKDREVMYRNWRFSQWYDWEALRENLKKFGIRNSLLTTCMPTASTAQILGNVESMEASTSNLYMRRVLAGDFIYANNYMLKDLFEMGIWNDKMKQRIIAFKGSVQNIEEIPKSLKNIYKTVWEISQKVVINLAADRALFIDQSQSLNIFMKDPSIQKIISMHLYGWKKKLKTGMYYLRTQAATDALQFTVSSEAKKEASKFSDESVLLSESSSEFGKGNGKDKTLSGMI